MAKEPRSFSPIPGGGSAYDLWVSPIIPIGSLRDI